MPSENSSINMDNFHLNDISHPVGRDRTETENAHGVSTPKDKSVSVVGKK